MPSEDIIMKWVTREKELGHHGDRCSFDAFLDRYRLDDPGRSRTQTRET